MEETESRAEPELEAAWERYRQSKFDEQEPLKDYLLERYGNKEYRKLFGKKRKQAHIDASVEQGRHKGEHDSKYARRGVLMRVVTRALAWR